MKGTIGFRNESSPEGVRLVIDDREAAIVRRIFEISASGVSLKGIATTLTFHHHAREKGGNISDENNNAPVWGRDQ